MKNLHEGYYVVVNFPAIQFYTEGNKVEHVVKNDDRLHIKVVFDRKIPGNIVSYITTHEKYTCIIKGDVVDYNHDKNNKNIVVKGFNFK